MMDWTLQDLGSIGEFFGAIGVVVTLIYLAVQVRLTNTLVRESNWRNQTDRAINNSRFVVATPGLMSIFRKGCEDLKQLSDDERWMFGTYMYSLCQGLQETYHLHRRGRTEEFYWQNTRDSILVYLRRPGGRQWCASAQSMFDQEFAAYLRAEM